jgi:8-oxo-dGTP pyrophosphatase MutT (NUDIX family)
MFTKPRKAATIAILKNSHNINNIFEVLLLKRHSEDRFLPSYFVFPGGALDEQDRFMGSLWADDDNKTEAQPDFNIYLYKMGAIRETFEESGLLLARDSSGNFVRIKKEKEIIKFSQYREMVYANRISFYEMLKEEKLIPAFDAIHYLSRWITPVYSFIRYDTRFFAASAPEDQYIGHDGIELVETRWMTPSDALTRYRKNEIKMALPTVSTLEFFSSFETTADIVSYLSENGGIN